MVILTGIDEAGYGPLLGPLVVSAAALEMPEDLLRADLWQLLGKAAAKDKKRLKGRLLVTDSKKAYTPAAGIGHLRRTVLSCLSAADPHNPRPQTAAELLTRLCPAAAERMADYPWHRNLARLPLGDNPQAIDVAAATLRRSLDEHGIRLTSLTARCLDVGFYNTRVEAVRNKSRVLFGELCGLIYEIIQNPAAESFQFLVDRQGGRINYHAELLRMFPNAVLSILRQDEKISSYDMTLNAKTVRIHFAAGADSRFFPVCLASMVSKYLRETLMESQNAFFLSLCQGLKPTAGYWQDGQRFLKDLAEHLPDFAYDPKKLVRLL